MPADKPSKTTPSRPGDLIASYRCRPLRWGELLGLILIIGMAISAPLLYGYYRAQYASAYYGPVAARMWSRPWYLLTGLAIGVVIGVLYAWRYPVNYTNTSPAALRADFKDQYRTLIAAAYMANGDLVRAKARLELLKDQDVYRTLSEQAQRTLAEGRYPQEARALGLLAIALGQAPPTVALASPAQTQASSPQATGTTLPELSSTPGAAQSGTSGSTPTPTRPPATLAPTFTPLPTRTATPTQGAPFILEREESRSPMRTSKNR